MARCRRPECNPTNLILTRVADPQEMKLGAPSFAFFAKGGIASVCRNLLFRAFSQNGADLEFIGIPSISAEDAEMDGARKSIAKAKMR
jgi:hypothetical protein